jgi:hypothetical protein
LDLGVAELANDRETRSNPSKIGRPTGSGSGVIKKALSGVYAAWRAFAGWLDLNGSKCQRCRDIRTESGIRDASCDECFENRHGW